MGNAIDYVFGRSKIYTYLDKIYCAQDREDLDKIGDKLLVELHFSDDCETEGWLALREYNAMKDRALELYEEESSPRSDGYASPKNSPMKIRKIERRISF